MVRRGKSGFPKIADEGIYYISALPRCAGTRGPHGVVAVGMRITPHPPHGSGLEELPHPALALGSDGSAARRVRMADLGRGQPAVDQSLHALPRHVPELASASQYSSPETAHSVAEVPQRGTVGGHSVITYVSADYRLQPLPHILWRVMQASLQVDLDRL